MQNGITLIALVITIIVLLILAGVAINALFGDNGLITRAQLSAYVTEMKKVKENVRLKQNEHALMVATGETKEELFKEELNTNNIKVPETFMQQMLYARNGYPSDKEPSDYKEDDYKALLTDGIIKGAYILEKNIGNNKENTYVYDKKSDIVFKIPKTTIGGKAYHCYEVAQMQKGGNSSGDVEQEKNQIIDSESNLITVGDETYYAPNMKGFNAKNTSLIYYSDDFSEQVEINAKEYIDNKENYQVEKEGKTYKLHDYGNKVWANAKTNANNLESWWVWIPRYAYKINGSSANPAIDIIYVDVNNKPLNKTKCPDGVLPADYTVQPGFTVDGHELKGIWISKYEPSYRMQVTVEGVLSPDMNGFDKDNTYIELFDVETNTFTDEIKLADADLNTVNTDKKWYDYEQKVWANIKTNANGLEAWWVWIPRYAYKINSLTNYKSADIIYVDTNDEPINKTAYPNGLPEGYVVHSAFNVDNKKLSGIWMSKYEPNYKTQIISDGVLEPDMTGFDKENTYIELFDSISNTFTNEIKLADADLSTINNDEKWYDYSSKVWANIKTTSNGKEAWWVWVPRYAYRVNNLTNYKTTDVIFVNTNDEPIDKISYPNGLPEGYIIHPGFDVGGKKLKGMWMSKYEPSYSTQTTSSVGVEEPEMTGFDKENTYIELFDSTSNTFTDEIKLADADLNTINSDNKWYDYEHKIWANIKTNANGKEAWWVWIPRYAYKINNLTNYKSTDIIYVDQNDEPLDKTQYPYGLPEGYTVHEGFNVDGKKLKGMWMSKYEPSNAK